MGRRASHTPPKPPLRPRTARAAAPRRTVGKKQGNEPRESKLVQEFSSGFVPRTEETDAAKAEAASWDRSQLLSAGADDAQVKIFDAYAHNANQTAEGTAHKRGLGASSGGAVAAGGMRRPMSFVAAGGAPAATLNMSQHAQPAASGAPLPPGSVVPTAQRSRPCTLSLNLLGTPLPPGWSASVDPSSGYPFYVHAASGATQWHPPPAAPPPAAPPPQPLPPGWHAVSDPTTGGTYYANPATGASQWTVPQAEPAPPLPSEPPPPLPPEPPPPLPDAAVSCGDGASSSAGGGRGGGGGGGASVRVRGIPGSMSDADVREVFGGCGRVVGVSLERGGYSAGAAVPKAGTVTFDFVGSAQMAVDKMHGTKLRGTRLEVELALDPSAAARGGAAGARFAPY